MDDTTSSVFPDYSHDVIWVGGASGWLQKFTGVFQGTPTRVTTGGFPVQVRATTFTSSPVYDFASNNVFIGDASGFFYRVSSTGVVTASGQLDFGTGVVAGPIVDGTTNRVYVFASSDGTTNCGGQPCTAVYQFGTGFAAGTTGNKAVVGNSVAFPQPPVLCLMVGLIPNISLRGLLRGICTCAEIQVGHQDCTRFRSPRVRWERRWRALY